MNNTDLITYGGVGVAAIIIAVVLYRMFKSKNGNVPVKNQVMNKINDFYSTQDHKDSQPNINY